MQAGSTNVLNRSIYLPLASNTTFFCSKHFISTYQMDVQIY
jgi:hypothetical protein